MDIGPTKSTSGITLTRCHFPLGEIVLGEFTPSEFDKVTSLDSFIFDKDKRRIVKQYHKKLAILEAQEFSITIETPLFMEIRKDPLALALARVAFSHAM